MILQNDKNYRIVVVGAGHVGLAYGALLDEKYDVTMVDIDEKKVEDIKNGKLPDGYPHKKMVATTSHTAYYDADLILIAVPTNFDEATHGLNCNIITNVLRDINRCNNGTKNTKPLIVIKSTVYIGYTAHIREELGMDNIIFSPEFLREDYALYDIKNPARLVVGTAQGFEKEINKYIDVMTSLSQQTSVPVLCMDNSEAEAVKLFSNAYLATRVAFINELDSYAREQGMDTRNIINGVCADPRIGNYYNNPSFGFGGYCLPKDTMQLSTLMRGSRSNVGSVVDGAILANKIRRFTCISEMMRHVQTLGKSPLHITIGIYRLNGLHNSVMRKVIGNIQKFTSNVIIYEPRIPDKTYDGCDVYEDLDTFKQKCDIIMADRVADELSDVMDKVYTADLTGNPYAKADKNGK